MPSEPSYRNILQDTLALLREIEAHYSPAALSNGFGPESHDACGDLGDAIFPVASPMYVAPWQ